MLKNYFLIALRSMMKSKLYIFINILGMAISIDCCITAYYNYDFNSSFDSYHQNAENLYRVNMVREFQGKVTEFGLVPVPLGETIRDNIADVQAITRYSATYAEFKLDDEIFDSNVSYVDKDFFSMFTFEFLHGSPSVIQDKSNLIISDELAMRLFNTTDAVGKSLNYQRSENPIINPTYKLCLRTT